MRLCCSFKHQDPFVPYEETTRAKICSGCRSAFYCSEACQEEDWIVFHSQECPHAACRQIRLGLLGVSERYRRNKLAFLVGVAALTLPQLPKLRAQDRDTTSFAERTEGDLPVVVFHASRDAFLLERRFDVWFIQTVSSFLSSYQEGLGVQAHARAMKFAKDMKPT
ncbi:hypothetical protein FA13DRAFT_1816049 [Coprinellus micaceus]|uniref:MYND-type domain-containing protein n=1 Tax=Coprinellus micaceus TaxID=71717 RepID=A0A4Y7T1P7_COPMI|nr:hypothetical protein FA13DRAFT_1816049 [Coprinellus micaceus]